MPFFQLLHKDKNSHARLGKIETDHGVIETPAFMPVGTQASVKTLDQADLEQMDASIILGNTYHLHLRPGEDLIAEQGGLHKFMNWNKPILTDSGGFQVFSLGLQKEKLQSKDQGKLVKIDDDGVTFSSHIDGSKHRFTPETSIEIQHKLGADIIMAFDECTPDDADLDYTKQALNRTHVWAKRSLEAHQKNTSYHGYRQFLFGIIQGAQHRDLREESARFISSLDFDGIAIGGESIGYNMKATAEIMDWVYPIIPEDKPHYTMGLGLNPLDLLIAVEHGADMFDCVAPTRLARHGMVYIFDPKNKHRLNITNASFTKDTKPLDPECACFTCQRYSRSYLHHLFVAEEMSGMRLASVHNLHFMLKFMKEIRARIAQDTFSEFVQSWRQA
jgi:tRNA-guanine transglycosylase